MSTSIRADLSTSAPSKRGEKSIRPLASSRQNLTHERILGADFGFLKLNIAVPGPEPAIKNGLGHDVRRGKLPPSR